VAGACDGSASMNQTLLDSPADILFMPNGTLYVNNNDRKILTFQPGKRTAGVLATFNDWPSFLFYDNRTSDLYISVLSLNLVYILPGYRTIPPNGVGSTACVLTAMSGPTGITMDSAGNLYVGSFSCNWITRWAPNATNGVIIAGSSTGSFGSSDILLSRPYGLLLDELNSVIYVADRYNDRVQRFPLNGSGIGVTVAGGNGLGSAANQLNGPTEIYRSKNGNFMYICDSFNHRVQRWPMNGTSGVTVAGSSSGMAGQTPYLMNTVYGFAFDPDESHLYVSDANNNRIQRFSLK
jgi:DNA-binding beta-propeller fold protein YncE